MFLETTPLMISADAMETRFRGYLPVVVDVETAGFNSQTDALLEIAAIFVSMNENGEWVEDEGITRHVQPFEGANLEQAALDFNGINPEHPFRKEIAVSEKQALQDVFKVVRTKLKQHNCKRAILVGHNPAFDIAFLNAAVGRCNIKRNPFHPFSTFDTVTLSGLAFGQTVLARAVEKAGVKWDSNEAHSARYDAERTAELFCKILNLWGELNKN